MTDECEEQNNQGSGCGVVVVYVEDRILLRSLFVGASVCVCFQLPTLSCWDYNVGDVRMSMEHWWNDKSRSTKKTSPSACFTTTSPIWTGLGSKLGLRGEKPETAWARTSQVLCDFCVCLFVWLVGWLFVFKNKLIGFFCPQVTFCQPVVSLSIFRVVLLLIILLRNSDECRVLKFFGKTPTVVSFNVPWLLSAGTEINTVAVMPWK